MRYFLLRFIKSRLSFGAWVGIFLTTLLWLSGLLSPVPVQANFAVAGALPGLGSGHIWSLAISPKNPNLCLAGTDNGVYRSEDGGQHWAGSALNGVRVWTVGFDVRSPNVVLAGLSDEHNPGGIRRSDDEGKSWRDVSAGLTRSKDVRVLGFGVDGIAAGTAQGVFVATDGQQWHDAGLSNSQVGSLVIAANTPQFTIVVGLDGGDVSAGYLLVNNGGAPNAWQPLNNNLPNPAVVTSMAVGPLPGTAQRRPLIITLTWPTPAGTAAGTFHSNDGGVSWNKSANVPTDPTAPQTNLTTVAFSPLDPNLAYGGSDLGGSSGGDLLRSTDVGNSFNLHEDGLPDKAHRSIETIAVSINPQPLLLVAMSPSDAPASIYREIDTTAPAPSGSVPEGSGAPIPVAVPTPVPVSTPTPKVSQPITAPTSPSSTGLRHLTDIALTWPFPLAIELVIVIGAVYAFVRWRAQYLEIEGPP